MDLALLESVQLASTASRSRRPAASARRCRFGRRRLGKRGIQLLREPSIRAQRARGYSRIFRKPSPRRTSRSASRASRGRGRRCSGAAALEMPLAERFDSLAERLLRADREEDDLTPRPGCSRRRRGRAAGRRPRFRVVGAGATGRAPISAIVAAEPSRADPSLASGRRPSGLQRREDRPADHRRLSIGLVSRFLEQAEAVGDLGLGWKTRPEWAHRGGDQDDRPLGGEVARFADHVVGGCASAGPAAAPLPRREVVGDPGGADLSSSSPD